MLPFRLKRFGGLDVFAVELGHQDLGARARFLVSTRRGGVSFDRADLNISFAVGDDVEAVIKNRNSLFKAIGITGSRVAGLRQRHSADVVEVSESNIEQLAKRKLEGDALISNTPGQWLSVSIGDCLAVFLFDPVRKAVALFHAGWAGTARRIAEVTIRRMESAYGCRPADMFAIFSPCIRPASYEVDEPVFDLFRKEWQGWERFIRDRKETRGYLDLPAANRWLLEARGIPSARILDFGLCTRSLSALFFSHRREGDSAGRMFALASLS